MQREVPSVPGTQIIFRLIVERFGPHLVGVQSESCSKGGAYGLAKITPVCEDRPVE